MASFTLVHSPVVGPVSWSWVGAELVSRGQQVAVPSLLRAAMTGSWQACADAAARQAGQGPGEQVLVGHSGAGPLLPVIASRLSPRPARLVFVDAGVPPLAGEARLVPDEFLQQLRALATDGRLPRWSEWFGPGLMEAQVPDAGKRAAVAAELPELPLAFFESQVQMPAGWAAAECAFVQLSDAYGAEAQQAAARGWIVTRLPGTHLDIVNRPGEIAELLIRQPGTAGRAAARPGSRRSGAGR